MYDEYDQIPAVRRSALWEIRKSPAHYKWAVENPSEDTPALKMGRAIHMAVLQPEEFPDTYAVMPDGIDRRTKEGKAAWAAWCEENDGKEVLTKEELETRRIDTACYLAENLHCTVLLKGKGTLIVSRQEDAENACNLTGDAGAIFRNPTGNPGMATAGAGDVLTGVITALLGQGLDVTAAACCGAYLHGRAGDLAAAEYGERSLIARDLIRKLPAAFRSGTLIGSGD